MVAYYIIVFNTYCNGVDRALLKKSLFFKKILRNIILVAITLSLSNIIKTQNIVLENFLTLKNSAETSLTGAGFIEATIKLVGEMLYSILIIVVAFTGVKYFKKEECRYGRRKFKWKRKK